MPTSIPKISIIIGVLNMKRYLTEALDSVIQQDYPNIELIVMDGGSTDGTIDTIKQYEKIITYWYSGKDKGHSDACNKAIKIASGDFILLLNADDILSNNLLHKVASLYQRYPDTKLITCGVRIVEKNQLQEEKILREITSPKDLQITLTNILFGLPVINARFFHREIFQQFGLFNPSHPDGSYNLSNDRDFLIKLALGEVQSLIIPEPLYVYLSHDSSLTFSQKNVIKSHKEHLLLAEKNLKNTLLTPHQRKLFKTWQARESVYLCLIYLLKLKLKDALSMLWYGMSHHIIMWCQQLSFIVANNLYRKCKKLSSH